MATLVWQPNCKDCLVLFRDGVIKQDEKYYIKVDKPTKRDGYMRTVPNLMLFFHNDPDMVSIKRYHTSPDEMVNFFNIDTTKYEKQYIENVDPWLCFTDDCHLVMYFGEDKPIRKQKTVKTLTKHRKTWEHRNDTFSDKKEHTYNYWSVKEPSKMLICDVWLDRLESTFPELPYKSVCLETYQPTRLNEPFKCSDEYDYSPEEKAEIIRKEKEKEEKRIKELEELEIRKHMDGYCDLCGSKAEYVMDPYQYEINGIVTYRWLCPSCYNSACGDI